MGCLVAAGHDNSSQKLRVCGVDWVVGGHVA